MTDGVTGRLAGIARRPRVRAPMEEMTESVVTEESGLDGDHKGPKFKLRRITVLAREDWTAALADLDPATGPVDLPWTTRRANLLVEGIALPRAKGGLVRIGPVLLEVTYETYPCGRMEQARKGLLKALSPNWRGGITCRVLEGGPIAVGDTATVLLSPPEQKPRLP